jgi:hypothetical protein
VAAWPNLKDRWLESAAVGAADKDPLLFLEAVFAAQDPAFVVGYVPHLARMIANRRDAALAGRMVQLLARQSAATDGLKAAALEALSAALDARLQPELDAANLGALKSLLASGRTAGSVLPLVARWKAASALAAELKPAIQAASSQIGDAALSDASRGQIAANLIGVRNIDPSVIPSTALRARRRACRPGCLARRAACRPHTSSRSIPGRTAEAAAACLGAPAAAPQR